MKPKISEFSFGFAITYEICNELCNLGFSAAPIFLNLRQEGCKGPDVEIPTRGFPLFLQFKLSDRMFRCRKPAEWNLYKTRYFRVYLHKRSHSEQHKHLQELSKEGHYVCYVSPIFFEPSELDYAYRYRQVVKKSLFVNVDRLPTLPDDETHYYTFLRGDDLKFWSKPSTIEGKFIGDVFLDGLINILKNENALRKINLEYIYGLRASLLKIIGPKQLPLDFNKKQDKDEDPIADVVYLCRAYLGCEVLFVGLSDREINNKNQQHRGRGSFLEWK